MHDCHYPKRVFCYTFKMADNPGYLSDRLWAETLCVHLLTTLTRYEADIPYELMAVMNAIPLAGREEVWEALEEANQALCEQNGGRLLHHADFDPDTIHDVRAMRFGPWLKLFITIEER